jgi:hypothetical protein
MIFGGKMPVYVFYIYDTGKSRMLKLVHHPLFFRSRAYKPQLGMENKHSPQAFESSSFPHYVDKINRTSRIVFTGLDRFCATTRRSPSPQYPIT